MYSYVLASSIANVQGKFLTFDNEALTKSATIKMKFQSTVRVDVGADASVEAQSCIIMKLAI